MTWHSTRYYPTLPGITRGTFHVVSGPPRHIAWVCGYVSPGVQVCGSGCAGMCGYAGSGCEGMWVRVCIVSGPPRRIAFG
eukprot:629220-Prorocentrum_minimum.AAC.1